MKTITTLLILSFLSANTLFARVHANYIGSGTSKIDTINGTSLRVNKMIRFRESKKDLLRKLGPPDSIVSRSSHYADSIFDYYYSNLVYEQEEGDSVSFSSIHLYNKSKYKLSLNGLDLNQDVTPKMIKSTFYINSEGPLGEDRLTNKITVIFCPLTDHLYADAMNFFFENGHLTEINAWTDD